MITHYHTLVYYAFWAALALILAYIFANYTYDVQGGVLVLLAICPIGFFLIRRMAKAEDGGWFLVILVVSFILKLAFSQLRIFTNETFYGGQFDSGRYHSVGKQVAEDLWHLDFGSILPLLTFQGSWGTRFTEFYSGLVHAVIGPTLYGAFLAFSLLSFMGLYFYYRAFCIAFPSGNRRLYAALLFLMPRLLFWPNGLGKDALMALFIGLAAYGAARAFSGEYARSMLPLAAGLFGAFTVRPHMVGILAIAMVAAFMLGAGELSPGHP
jgi:hypothetical protein